MIHSWYKKGGKTDSRIRVTAYIVMFSPGSVRLLNWVSRRASAELSCWRSGPDTSARSTRRRCSWSRRRWRPRDKRWRSWSWSQKSFMKQQSVQIQTSSLSSTTAPVTRRRLRTTRLQKANTTTLRECTRSEVELRLWEGDTRVVFWDRDWCQKHQRNGLWEWRAKLSLLWCVVLRPLR